MKQIKGRFDLCLNDTRLKRSAKLESEPLHPIWLVWVGRGFVQNHDDHTVQGVDGLIHADKTVDSVGRYTLMEKGVGLKKPVLVDLPL